MKRILLFAISLFYISITAQAESNIFVFTKSLGNCDIQIAIDGKNICDLNGSVKREQKFGLKIPSVIRQSCYRKIETNKEGKIIVTISFEFQNSLNGNITRYKSEYPLDLEDGETYNLQLAPKGMHDMQIKEPKPKDVQKWLKKWEELPTVIY